MNLKTLETSRLLLRAPHPEDALPMYRNWAGDAQVTTYLTWPPHSSAEVSARIIDFWIRENGYQWMIVLKELGEPIGSISAMNLNEEIRKAEIGYCIGKPWWGQGIMTEALGAVIDYLFDEVGLNRIEAFHDVRNPASGGVMKKCGMTYEGTLRQNGKNNQGICDICCYAVLKKERPL